MTAVKETSTGEVTTPVKKGRSRKVTVEKTSKAVEKEIKLKYTKRKIGTETYYVFDNGFMVPEGIFQFVKHNIETSQNTLLIGPTSVGKTELAYNIGKALGLDVTIFDMGTMLDPVSTLVGIHAITNDGTSTKSTFVPSRFSQAIQRPGLIILDEISRASLQSNNLLFPVLDFRKELNMEYSFIDSDPIKVHPGCVFIATANIGSEYSGTNRIDRALLDRFFTVNVNTLPKAAVQELFRYLHPDIKISKLNKAVDIFFQIDQLNKDFKINFSLGLRHLKQICAKIRDGFTIYDSFFVICNSLSGGENTEIIAILKTATEDAKLKLFEV